MPFFSIIIPAFNAESYLFRSINSVLLQDDDDFEIIVVNDGSTDSTGDLANEIAIKYYKKIKVLNQSNQGPGAARNNGAAFAKGKYFVFLDADDEMSPSALSFFRNEIEKHPAADFFLGAHYSVGLHGKKKKHPQSILSADREKNFVNFISGNLSISQGKSAISKKIFSQFKFPESIRNNEDLVFYATVLALFNCVSFHKYVVVIHKRENSLRHNAETIIDSGLKPVELLFNSGLLPFEFMKYKSRFEAHRHLAFFRAMYRSGRNNEAKNAYYQAIKEFPLNLLDLNSFRKFLKLQLGLGKKRKYEIC